MKKLPVGIDDFRKIRENDYYYVDKTNLIRDIIDNGSEVTLFTRPRRFGKTLNMSMLKAFFEIGADPAWFEELKISKEKDLCDKHLGKYPVIFMSLKEVSGLNYEEAVSKFRDLMAAPGGNASWGLERSQSFFIIENIVRYFVSIL